MLDSEKTDRKTSLYRHYDAAGRLLYVGISFSVLTRTAQHAAYSPWWDDVARIDVEGFPNRSEAEAAEVAAIKDEKPLFNKKHAERVIAEVSVDLPETPEAILAARETLALTQGQLAVVMGLRGPAAISEWERGVKHPDGRSVRLIRAYLDGYRPVDWPA